MMRFAIWFLWIIVLIACAPGLYAQKRTSSNNLVYVDEQGVLRFTKNNTEAAFFGVNYTAPFAYAYRAHKALNIDLKKAMQQDVYHMARLGLDAFRVHVWDTEISDTLGNLLQNEHLDLFDFLLAELKKRNIKIIITPIAFWGNGYPERDEATPGFSTKYGKGRATTNDTAIAAQENYLRQFFTHVNPYTHLTYGNDPGVIAVELNNEPSHSGPKSGVTTYINRLAAATRSTGFTKPLYYNIAQSPYYADAVAKANIEGVSFQWYPTGLVANQEVEGNFLPNVDHYTIPFDTIPEYRTKSKMVYEYDAADLLQSCMYPAMARSFREAGFQWATQFAYDPLALAYANTEYQTHYLNLAYTPSKAISLLIASKAFHQLPRLKSYGDYPADSIFDAFRVSYKNSLSEMNTPEEFYYSNTTATLPVNAIKLRHVAGVGSSPVVHYEGLGAYFLDKLADGNWRLELMPDAIHIRDPFEKAAPSKEVTRIEWQPHAMSIVLNDLGEGFSVKGLNDGNAYTTVATGNRFSITPGTYLLTKAHSNTLPAVNKTGELNLPEFVAPKPFSDELDLQHTPYEEVTAGKAFTIEATIVGMDAAAKITLQVSKAGGGFGSNKMLAMQQMTPYHYAASIPVDMVSPGQLSYRIIIQKPNSAYVVFPGNHKGNPFAWDNYNDDYWHTFVAAESGSLELFNATTGSTPKIYPTYSRGFQTGYVTGVQPRQLVLRLAANELPADHVIGMQVYVGDKLAARSTEFFDKLVIRAGTAGRIPVTATVTLINTGGVCFEAGISLSDKLTDIEVPLDRFKPGSMLLLPRPYPGFLPLWFKAPASSAVVKLSEVEKVQVTIGTGVAETASKQPYTLEVASIWLEKN